MSLFTKSEKQLIMAALVLKFGFDGWTSRNFSIMQPEHFAMGSNEFISFYEQENSCKREGIEENCILHLKL